MEIVFCYEVLVSFSVSTQKLVGYIGIEIFNLVSMCDLREEKTLETVSQFNFLSLSKYPYAFANILILVL